MIMNVIMRNNMIVGNEFSKLQKQKFYSTLGAAGNALFNFAKA